LLVKIQDQLSKGSNTRASRLREQMKNRSFNPGGRSCGYSNLSLRQTFYRIAAALAFSSVRTESGAKNLEVDRRD